MTRTLTVQRQVEEALKDIAPAIDAHPTLQKLTIDVVFPKGKNKPVVYLNMRSKCGDD